MINKEVVSGMIAFDVWMCNRDRNTGNVLFQRPSPGVKQYTMSLIDHSHALIGDLPNIQVLYQHIQAQGDPKWFVGATPMELRSMVKTADNFEVWLKGIEELDMTQVRQAGEVLPKEWILNIEQYDELLQFIANRAREVRRLITANPNLFFFP